MCSSVNFGDFISIIVVTIVSLRWSVYRLSKTVHNNNSIETTSPIDSTLKCHSPHDCGFSSCTRLTDSDVYYPAHKIEDTSKYSKKTYMASYCTHTKY